MEKSAPSKNTTQAPTSTKKKQSQDVNAFSRSHIWLFNSGDQFSGNVKYLFLYVVSNRTDIFACYITESKKNADYIMSLGYQACVFNTPRAKELTSKAGYYVVEQVKENYPDDLLHVKIVNLFHGVGLKAIERCWSRDFLGLPIAKKYIRYNTFFRKNMTFLVTSPFMEEHFKQQLDLRDDQLIRAAYPRCKAADFPKTYDPKLVLDSPNPNATIALYVPTYREHNSRNFLYKAISDIYALLDVLRENNIVLIIKLHPKINDDFYFDKLASIAINSNNLILWDNKYDVYEIFDKIDIGIIDYSSMYYDLLAAGVKNFIRYVFDYNDENEFLIYDYFSNTTGTICETFDQLLQALADCASSGASEKNTEKNKAILQKFWAYAKENDCEAIIDQAMRYQIPEAIRLPTLYSFDVFDTLIARHVLRPVGIFYAVLEKICRDREKFPPIFALKYPEIRMDAEANVREHIKKTVGDFEITFDAIFERLGAVYGLTEGQKEQLRAWELEAEFANVRPIEQTIAFVESLIDDGETVVLISDMYLPKKTIAEMLALVSQKIAKLPLFCSSERTVQKTTQKLYLDVYRALAPYTFGEWHHYGDNRFADASVPRLLGIQSHVHTIPQFNQFEEEFVAYANSYDAFLLAGMVARFRTENHLNEKEYYAFAHIGFCFLPYIAWAVRDAVAKKIDTLYFISRDGYFLQKIADTYIALFHLPLTTKYIYGSRKVWRLPAMIDAIDDEFFSNFGNFVGVDSYEKLLRSLDCTHSAFQKLFPELGIETTTKLNKSALESLASYFKSSEKFQHYLLDKAATKREIVVDYLRQEIDFSQNFAFVEFWGRGYTQTLFGRLLDLAAGKEIDNRYYYFRTILPTEGRNIRYNFTTNTTSVIFVEAIFANYPTQTVSAYTREGTRIVPVMEHASYDAELFSAMETRTLQFVERFYDLPFLAKENVPTLEYLCANFELSWFKKNQADPVLVQTLAHLKDSVELWGDIREFAPAFTHAHLSLLENGRSVSSLTRSLPMSLARASEEVRAAFEAFQKNGKIPEHPQVQVQRSKKDRLLLKLDRDPKRFFADSKNPFLRALGALCLSSVFRANIGKLLVATTRKSLSHKN